MSVFRSIFLDYRRYRAAEGSWFETVFLTQGFWAASVYRVHRAVLQGVKIRFLRRLLGALFALLQKGVEVATGISVPPNCEIGEGLYIGHFGNIILPSQGLLGNNCNIQQGVTIGVAGPRKERGAPVVGDRVYFGPNAVVLGKITVGNDAMICAGAVVVRSVPPRAVMMGNPARVIGYEGSFDYIRYDNMDKDPERQGALAAGGPARGPCRQGGDAGQNGVAAVASP